MNIRKAIRNAALGASLTAGLMSSVFAMNSEAASIDLDTDYAYSELIIPTVVPAIYKSVSPSAGDATLVLRIAALLTNAWFDAIAPYHPTAVGVYSNLGRRPEAEQGENYYLNVATLYASYRILNNLLPTHAADWRAMMEQAGLDPDDDQENMVTPIGIGNLAGKAVAEARENDGMNQLGNEGGREYNRTPYADYTGYRPVNTPYQLRDPSRWQPDVKLVGAGLYVAQQFVTPQMRLTEPYSLRKLNKYRAPVPQASNVRNFREYKHQVDEVIDASANLTDEQKMITEEFNDKLRSLGFSGLFASQQAGLSLAESIHYEFVTNIAEFDTAIAVWDNKVYYDTVRPFSAVRYVYKDKPLVAWGGPGKGTVDDIPASQWKGYLSTADHPDYPSGSASFCGAQAEVSRMFFKTDAFNWHVSVPKGSSLVEPGFTPQTDLVLEFPTWTNFEQKCGMSRLWGGVHFNAAITEGRNIGHKVAKDAYKFMQSHLNGDATK